MYELAQTLARLSAILGHPDDEPVPLEGGITNRNFKVHFGGLPYVIREPGKDTALLGIDRSAEWAASCAAARAGVGPPVRAMLENPPILVTGFVEGRPASEDELRRPELLRTVAGALRRIHDSGEELPSSFSAFRTVEAYAETAKRHGAKVPEGYNAASKKAKAIEKALRGPEHEPVPCHNDLLSGNFILDGDALHIVDWEYAGMNDRFFDLGNFAVNNELGDDGARALLRAYLESEPTDAQLAALALQRYVSDLREAMWGVVQAVLSDLDFDYPAYAGEHLARLRSTAADPRFEEWMAVAGAA